MLYAETPELDTDCEIIWCRPKLNIIGCKTLYLGSLYDPRHEKTGLLHLRKQRRRSASR